MSSQNDFTQPQASTYLQAPTYLRVSYTAYAYRPANASRLALLPFGLCSFLPRHMIQKHHFTLRDLQLILSKFRLLLFKLTISRIRYLAVCYLSYIKTAVSDHKFIILHSLIMTANLRQNF